MLRNLRRIITGLAFLVYIPIGMVIPWALAAEDVDLVVASAQRLSVAESKENRIDLKRGQFIKTDAFVINQGSASSGPFDVGIYLSEDPDGQSKFFEFDVITNLNLSASEYISIKGEYVIPFYITPARFYWVVVEADYDKSVTEKDENNKKVIQKINVLCDEFILNYSDTYLCPFGDGIHYDD